MKGIAHNTVQLGDLVVAAFDEAAHWSSDPREVSRLATGVVRYVIRCSRKHHIQQGDKGLLIEVSHEIPSAP
jgi:hypothetical protein